MNRLMTALLVSFLIAILIPLPALAAAKKTKKTVTEPAAPAAAEPVTPLVLPGFTDPTTGMEFVQIKGGCFKMGDSFGDGEDNEKPVHEVCVSDFAIGKYEVTNAQYRAYNPKYSSGNYKGRDLNGDNQPVVNVNYKDEAAAFTSWLSGKSGRKYRLPTEAEWEYAARAGTTGRNYWGSGLGNPCAYANIHDMTSKRVFPELTTKNHSCKDGYEVSAPVGSYKPNAFGLYDMMGNVWEWVGDWYGDYGSGKQIDPQGAPTGWARVIRGGSWFNTPQHARSAKRSHIDPGFRLHNLGFRLVAPLESPSPGNGNNPPK